MLGVCDAADQASSSVRKIAQRGWLCLLPILPTFISRLVRCHAPFSLLFLFLWNQGENLNFIEVSPLTNRIFVINEMI